MTPDEKLRFAIHESHKAEAERIYFMARSDIDTPANRKLFTDGFDRGWGLRKYGDAMLEARKVKP